MKKTILVLTMALGLGGIKAATFNIGDTNSLYLGFYAADSISTDSVLINIGSPNLVISGYTFDMSGASSVLSSTFGSGWHTNSEVFWGVFGRVSSSTSANTRAWISMADNDVELYTDAEGGTNISSTKWGNINSGITTTVGYYNNTGGAVKSTITNSKGDILQVSVAPNSGTSYNVYAMERWFVFVNPVDAAVTTGLDIQSWNKSGTSYINQTTFGVVSQSNGVISVVPEPATYALFGFGALLLIIAYRRKQAA